METFTFIYMKSGPNDERKYLCANRTGCHWEFSSINAIPFPNRFTARRFARRYFKTFKYWNLEEIEIYEK